MSLLVSADTKSMPLSVYFFGVGTRLLNALLGSSVRFQHLPVPFELYSDGIDLPVFEEFGAGTAALHLRDQLQRNKLLADREYRREFPAHHQANQLFARDSRHAARLDHLAIAQHGHAIGDLREFLEPMRDVDDADSLLPKLPNNSVKILCFPI